MVPGVSVKYIFVAFQYLWEYPLGSIYPRRRRVSNYWIFWAATKLGLGPKFGLSKKVIFGQNKLKVFVS